MPLGPPRRAAIPRPNLRHDHIGRFTKCQASTRDLLEDHDRTVAELIPGSPRASSEGNLTEVFSIGNDAFGLMR